MDAILSLLILPFIFLWVFLIWWLTKPKFFPFYKTSIIPSRLTIVAITVILYVILTMILVLTTDTSGSDDDIVATNLDLLAALFSVLLLILLGLWSMYVANRRHNPNTQLLTRRSQQALAEVNGENYVSNLYRDNESVASFNQASTLEQNSEEHEHDINLQPLDQISDQQKYQLIVKIAQLINTLHQQGWCHGDINPNNIITDDDTISNTDLDDTMLNLLLTDYGLAQRISDKKSSNNVLGASAYQAPECWQAQGITEQSDIYAFGVTMYEILTGTQPFSITLQSENPAQDWAQTHINTAIPTLPQHYQHYQTIINKALAKQVENRYQSMSAVLDDLDKFISQ